VTLSGTVRLRLKVRRCEVTGCARYHSITVAAWVGV
jgi:hypothetical protein